ncbi:MAG: hypothetical protein SO183_07410 [Fusobacterium mortiferum]|uniref:Uncharacterized protein n=1 Tax=Fusobacterium mortiferum ATCC 9817 TaxID=469616 RepID=A0ABM6TYE4_FUSMR|nr:hypothetical protein [Fusobacterium mortiferum]AVQ19408.1 hypothetical protein C4N19_10015 [Fusobacterium mortiferum ATCC 9817]MDY4801446.1 hypothetical protein [Fusobacterium mortiferum]
MKISVIVGVLVKLVLMEGNFHRIKKSPLIIDKNTNTSRGKFPLTFYQIKVKREYNSQLFSLVFPLNY